MKRDFSPTVAVIISCLFLTAFAKAEDIVIADFEGSDYGDWTVQGEAFGPGPTKGTLPGQMHVSGFKGTGLVNTYHGGDAAKGILTSPPFRIERGFLNFLIGGGGYSGQTCLNLLVNGKIVRTATGPNTEGGGSEELHLQSWDVSNLANTMASIEIVDRRSGGWGHINVDQIVQSDQKPKVAVLPGIQSKNFSLDSKYLLFPIRNGAKMTKIDVNIDGRNVREFDAELARIEEEVSFWSFLDISGFNGKHASLKIDGATKEGLEMIVQSDEIPGHADFLSEALRPQFHFSQKLGWNNDPNGMVYYDGEWHLYFQHNPYGWKWGNMHWGHAVSKDLVHWEQLPIAIYNKRRGDWAFSGGAVVDEKNTAGWQTGTEKVIVASWTSTGRGECVAFSNDRGRTFTEFEGNPVIKHRGRDPKIIWYEPGQHWVLAVYDESEEHGKAIALYTSNDMKEWKLQSKLKGYYECAEIFELPVDGDQNNRRWVIFAADARYAVGTFDGKTFNPTHEGKHRVHYGKYYASQLFSNAPDGRRIQIGWAQIPMPDMPFNQTFTVPHRLTLRSTDEGIRMFAEPVKEIQKLHQKKHSLKGAPLTEDKEVSLNVSGDLFDITATFQIGAATMVGLDLGGERVTYDVNEENLRDASLKPKDGKVTIRVLVDRPMLEIIGNDGQVYITTPRQVYGGLSSVRAFAQGGEAHLVNLEVHELKSIWEN